MAPRIPASIFSEEKVVHSLTTEEEQLKREIYNKMRPNRRKFVDRLGYDNWDPFQEPNYPLDLRVDTGMRTTEQLLNAFLRSLKGESYSELYRQGALDSAIAVVSRDEKYRGIFDFCLWYYDLLQKEGHIV